MLMILGIEDRVNPIDKNAAILAKAMPKRTRAVLDCTSDGALNRHADDLLLTAAMTPCLPNHLVISDVLLRDLLLFGKFAPNAS